MSRNIRDLALDVADTRRREAALTAVWKTRVAAFEAANADLRQEMAEAQGRTEQAEVECRRLALEIYTTTATKAPCPGISIKEFQTLAYDADEALTWATAHDMALALDKRAFEAIAKSGNIPFVAIGSEPRVQLATNMDKVLSEVVS